MFSDAIMGQKCYILIGIYINTSQNVIDYYGVIYHYSDYIIYLLLLK